MPVVVGTSDAVMAMRKVRGCCAKAAEDTASIAAPIA